MALSRNGIIEDEWLAEIIEQFGLQGVLLYGSYGKGQEDTWSDVDLLGVANDGILRIEKLVKGDRNIELCMAPPHIIKMSLGSTNPTNDNIILNALYSGACLWDPKGIVGELVEEAKLTRSRGPIRMSRAEYFSQYRQLEKAVKRCGVNCARRDGDPVREGVSHVMAAQTFQRIIIAYARAMRLWTSSLPETLEFFRHDAPEFHALCCAYIEASSLEDQAEALAAMFKMYDHAKDELFGPLQPSDLEIDGD